MKLKLKVGSFKKPERKECKILHPVNLKIAQAGKMAIWGGKIEQNYFQVRETSGSAYSHGGSGKLKKLTLVYTYE